MAISKKSIGIPLALAIPSAAPTPTQVSGPIVMQGTPIEITLGATTDYVNGLGLVVTPASVSGIGPSALPFTPVGAPGTSAIGAPPGVQGAGTITTSGTTVTGSGTAFLTSLAVGSTITAQGQTQIVSAIASNTSLTTAAAFAPAIAVASTYIIGADVPLKLIYGGVGYLLSSTGTFKGAMGMWVRGLTVPAFLLYKTGVASSAFAELANSDAIFAANDVFVGFLWGST